MTSEKDISDQIAAMYNKFWNSPYDRKIPEGLVSKFREAIMFQTPRSLPAGASTLRDLVAKKEYDLNFLDVGIILNVLFNTPMNTIFFTPEHAMESLIEYKEIEVEYNKIVEKKSREIEAARQKKLEICGYGKTVHMNGQPRKN